MATSAEQERRRFSYKDYCKWTDDGRWELIDGVEYDMSPAPSGFIKNYPVNCLSGYTMF